MNNFERIKNLSLDEMADWLINMQEILTQTIEDSIGYLLYRKREYRKLLKQWLEKECEE